MPRGLKTLIAALPRVVWGLLAAVHVPVFIAVISSMVLDGPTLGCFANLIALVATIAFFWLKAHDVAFLRFGTRQQSFVVVCLLTAIVHRSAIVPGPDANIFAQTTAVVLATGTVHRLVLRRRALALGWASRLAALLTTTRELPSRCAGWCEHHVPSLLPGFQVPQSVPRAPPA
jgi:hypothetical protein